MNENNHKLDKNSASMWHWYVVNCYSGNENKVKEAIENRIEAEAISENIQEVLIADYTERRSKIKKDGSEEIVEKIKNSFPGYIFVKMRMSDRSWFVVRNTPGVTGFIGSSGRGAKPFPLTSEEVKKVKALHGKVDDSLLNIEWSLDEVVEIKNGSMKGQVGKIYELNQDNKTTTIHIDIFGRSTPVEVSFDDIKKIK